VIFINSLIFLFISAISSGSNFPALFFFTFFKSFKSLVAFANLSDPSSIISLTASIASAEVFPLFNSSTNKLRISLTCFADPLNPTGGLKTKLVSILLFRSILI